VGDCGPESPDVVEQFGRAGDTVALVGCVSARFWGRPGDEVAAIGAGRKSVFF
jgi:hypothetical protein